MDTLLGIKGPDFVILATDMAFKRSIVVMREDEPKVYYVSNNLMFSAIGDGGDPMQFADYISKNLTLYKIRNGYDLAPKAAANFTRRNLADFLRSRSPYMVHLLMAGYDPSEGPQLFYIDYLANSKDINYGSHGYGGFFAGSIFARYWHKDLTKIEALDILKMCVAEIHKRLIINCKNFHVTIIDKDGAHVLENITPQSLFNYKPIELNNF